jgi:hypothetical protein
MHSKSKHRIIKTEAKRLGFFVLWYFCGFLEEEAPIRELVKEESEWANVFHGESF